MLTLEALIEKVALKEFESADTFKVLIMNYD